MALGMYCHQPVVKKQLFTSLDGSLGKNPYPVIAVNHHHCRERAGVSDSGPGGLLTVHVTRVNPDHSGQPAAAPPPGTPTYLLHSSLDLLSDLQNEFCYPCGLHPPRNLKRKNKHSPVNNCSYKINKHKVTVILEIQLVRLLQSLPSKSKSFNQLYLV